MSGWIVYVTSQMVICPGLRTDRRSSPLRATMGDRRHDPRPCTKKWGRVVAGEWHVRQKRLGQEPVRGEALVLHCEECHGEIEFVRLADRGAA